MKYVVDVVAALIWQDNKFMICQRPENKTRPLMWEFVGGKVEPGETKEAALVRDCREELGVIISVDSEFMQTEYEYPDMYVRLTVYNAKIVQGTPVLKEHSDLKWIEISEADCFMFCPADMPVLKKLKKED
jgi:8-oxo-dGTP diphosphatase